MDVGIVFRSIVHHWIVELVWVLALGALLGTLVALTPMFVIGFGLEISSWVFYAIWIVSVLCGMAVAARIAYKFKTVRGELRWPEGDE